MIKKLVIIGSVFGGFFGLILVSVLFIAVMGGEPEGNGNGTNEGGMAVNISDAVLAHRPTVEKYCREFGITEYISYILAIMQVESGGMAVDVMQSSESLGLPPNSLGTEDSIKQGCYYFSTLLIAAEIGNCDIYTVIQAYNYGAGFVRYVADRGGKYSFAVAMSFAEEYSEGQRVEYQNPIAVEINGGWRYGYGNMFYVNLVLQYIGIAGDFAWPSDLGNIITSVYGDRAHPITGINHKHNGVDIAADHGTGVLSIANGKVTVAAWDAVGYGNYVIIEHADGYKSLYAHMAQRKVSIGSTVLKGQAIGLCGSTGDSTGSHIHLEVWKDGERIDPLTLYSDNIYKYN